jgi:hypothetical protein
MPGCRQPALARASRRLDAVNRALNGLAPRVKAPVKFGRILEGLVGTLRRPEAMARRLTAGGWPVRTDKAFIPENSAVCERWQAARGGRARLGLGRPPVVEHGPALHRRQPNPVVAEGVQLPGGPLSSGSPACTRARRRAALLAQHGDRWGSHPQRLGIFQPKHPQPFPPHPGDPRAPVTGPAIGLALLNHLRKCRPVIGRARAPSLALAPLRNASLGHPQRQPLPLPEFRLCSGCALQPVVALGLLPISHPPLTDRQPLTDRSTGHRRVRRLMVVSPLSSWATLPCCQLDFTGDVP